MQEKSQQTQQQQQKELTNQLVAVYWANFINNANKEYDLKN